MIEWLRVRCRQTPVPRALPFDGMPIMLLLFYAIQWNMDNCTYCRSECHRRRMLDLMENGSFGDTLDGGDCKGNVCRLREGCQMLLHGGAESWT